MQFQVALPTEVASHQSSKKMWIFRTAAILLPGQMCSPGNLHSVSPFRVVQVEEFDYFIRKKDQGKAATGLAEAKTALDKVLSAVA